MCVCADVFRVCECVQSIEEFAIWLGFKRMQPSIRYTHTHTHTHTRTRTHNFPFSSSPLLLFSSSPLLFFSFFLFSFSPPLRSSIKPAVFNYVIVWREVAVLLVLAVQVCVCVCVCTGWLLRPTLLCVDLICMCVYYSGQLGDGTTPLQTTRRDSTHTKKCLW